MTEKNVLIGDVGTERERYSAGSVLADSQAIPLIIAEVVCTCCASFLSLVTTTSLNCFNIAFSFLWIMKYAVLPITEER